ncbi:MAG: pyrroline-5-carboxylate reductase [Pseudomonadota bacterium]|jgi:pyrroline-5-carboxylate reductase|nr:MAG: pyrroline-5-carboxylate reductase [Pseudomonadota bacterium]
MTAPQSTRIAFVGGGNMARALLGGLLARGTDPERIAVSAPSDATRAALARQYGINVSADNRAAVAGARIVVLAVKPQIMEEVVRPLAAELQLSRPLVISVAAGIRIAELSKWVGEGVPVVRAMPNRPALIGAGATGLYAGPEVGDTERAQAEQLLAATGLAVWVENEEQMDLVTALSGSGPAYFFRLAELMAEAAAAEGLDPGVARRLAAQTLAGAGRMVAAESSPDIAAMRAAVTSKGGTTAAALARFDELKFGETVREAVRAAAARSRELADGGGR